MQINQDAIAALKQQLADKLEAATEAGTQVVYDTIHVRTGRLQSTVRREDAVIGDNKITCNIKAGGMDARGVRFEQDVVKPVDYGWTAEVRRPLLRPAMPAIADAIRAEFN